MVPRSVAVAVVLACLAQAAPAQRYGTPLPVSRIGFPVADTITQNPAAMRRWLRHKVQEDLVDLNRLSVEILEAMESADAAAMRKVAKHPGKIVKLSRSLWSNAQSRKPSRARPDPGTPVTGRPLDRARTDTESARRLIRDIAGDLLVQQRSREIDAKAFVETLEKIERLELLGHQLTADLSAYR